MRHFSTSHHWLLLAAYPLLGLALGLGDPALGRLIQQLGVRPGVAPAITVNLLLPIAAVALGLAHARPALAAVGAAAMGSGLIVGLALSYPPAAGNWSIAALLASIPPVVVVATIAYAIIGMIAAWAVGARAARLGGRSA